MDGGMILIKEFKGKNGKVYKYDSSCWKCDFCEKGELHYKKYGREKCKKGCDVVMRQPK